MSKTRDTGFLGNVVKYDANGNVTVVNGATTLLSVSSSGQLTVPGNEVITGSLTVLGGITGAITGSATSASYAANTSLLNGSGSGEFVPTGSFNTFSSSILTYTGSANSRLGSLETTSGSNITRISALESASGSAITRLGALEVTSGSNITRLSALETASGSAITRLSALESRTGSYATTGSNTFVGGQYLSSSFNPTGFSTTASLYTDGGLRVTRDAYISGTLYLNNVTVFGTQSVAYISSSQLNIGTNIITVNTDIPSVRFGGLAVYDSGSTGLTGSMLWDSQDNQWIYSNPSGSTYDSAMFLVGPRNTGALGSEVGINCNFLSKGNGMHHMTSSGIFEDGSRTCFYGNSFISSSGAACFAGDLQVGGIYRDFAGEALLQTNTSCTTLIGTSGAGAAVRSLNFLAGNNSRLCISNTGIATFTCQVCAPTFAGGTAIFGSGAGTCINITTNGNNGTSGSPLQTSLNFRGLNNNLNGQIRVDDISGTIQIGSMQFYTWNSAQVSALTLCHNATAVFYGTVSAPSFISSGAICSTGNACVAGLLLTCTIILQTPSTNSVIDILRLNNPSVTSSGTRIKFENGYGDLAAIRVTHRDNGALADDGQIEFQVGSNAVLDTKMTILNTGNVGIGLTNPSCYYSNQLVVSAGSEGGITIANPGTTGAQYLMFADGTTGSDRFRGYMSYNHTDNSMTFATDANTRFTITGTGIACFACQVCAPRITIPTLRVSDETTFGLTACKGPNSYPIFYADGAQGIGFLTAQSSTFGERLRIFHTGEACFACTVCAPGFSTQGFIRANGSMKTFAISKNFGERQTNADYFRMSAGASSAYQVMIYSVSQNVGVGWNQSQLFHASTAPYWGGWIGTSGAVSTLGNGSGYISSAVIGNDGTITFRVTTGDNGTSTTGTILSYIQVTAFNIDNVSITAL